VSDLGVPGATTVSCPVCGNQADAADAFCPRCGASLAEARSEGSRAGQLELDEAERAAAAAGFDVDAEVADHHALCPTCGLANPLSQRVGSGRSARDTPTGRDDLEVLTLRCERCDTAMRVTVDRGELTAEDEARDEAGAGGARGPAVVEPDGDTGGPATGTDDPGGRRTPGGRPDVQSADRPVSHVSFADEVERFEPAGPGTLAEQRDLLDDDGDDIRMYTGEPVETDEGWVLPQQQNFAGRDNIAGGGEWPDPDTPRAQARLADPDDAGPDAGPDGGAPRSRRGPRGRD
jgi:hypothetical protein